MLRSSRPDSQATFNRGIASTTQKLPSVGETGQVEERSDHLGSYVRAWRQRPQPESVGLSARGPRRTIGLRREELASLAGISVDYLVRLEQGRAVNPSTQVLAALARALRLSVAERDHLYAVAGQASPKRTAISSHLTPSTQRLLERLDDVPVSVYDAAWTIIAWNPAGPLHGRPVNTHGTRP